MAEEKKIVRIGSSVEEKEIPEYYVNSVRILGSLYEFMFICGLKSDPEKEPEATAIIRMSPQHAKVFGKLLIKNVESYEKDIGEIKLPDKLIKDLGI